MRVVKETELNREHAEKLSKLILDNPELPVVAWISSDGISDDYAYWRGNIGEPRIQDIVYSEDLDAYFEREENDEAQNCINYYGFEAEEWSDEKIHEKAKEIPWEKVIAIEAGRASDYVSTT